MTRPAAPAQAGRVVQWRSRARQETPTDTELRIGEYRVLRPIGQGGMGAVYDAIHEPTAARVAIKVLQPRYAVDQDLVLRFFNEARAASAIAHPGIVRVFGAARLPDGTCFIAMEHLEGEPLSARLRRSGGTLRGDALRIAQQVAEALAAAHGKGILHRDLKPSNIMLVPRTGGEQATVIDFGIAKMQGDTPLPDGQDYHTRTGSMLGTPIYMSPEQCRGVRQGDRTDVYSLGVLLYQMLLGRPPFVSAADGDVIAMHILVPPQAPRTVDATVPEPLSRLCERMLAKTPEDRPSMAEVVAELGLLRRGGDRLPEGATTLTPQVALSGGAVENPTSLSAAVTPASLAGATGERIPEGTKPVPRSVLTPVPLRRRALRMALAGAATLLVCGSLALAVSLRSAGGQTDGPTAVPLGGPRPTSGGRPSPGEPGAALTGVPTPPSTAPAAAPATPPSAQPSTPPSASPSSPVIVEARPDHGKPGHPRPEGRRGSGAKANRGKPTEPTKAEPDVIDFRKIR